MSVLEDALVGASTYIRDWSGFGALVKPSTYTIDQVKPADHDLVEQHVSITNGLCSPPRLIRCCCYRSTVHQLVVIHRST